MFGIGSTEIIILIVMLIIVGVALQKKKVPQKEGSHININIKDTSSSVYDKLTTLKELLDKGVLTQEEFESEKKKLLK